MAIAKASGIRPAIVISSSPWKAGSTSTPWHDVFDVQNGHVRYFGDSKAGSAKGAAEELGNAALLDQLTRHRSSTPEDRQQAVPLLLFRAVSRDGADKGFREFCGLGLLERAERVVQWDEKSRSSFANYVYDITILDLSAEDEHLDWSWINARGALGAEAALLRAPKAWRLWVAQGDRALPTIRRRAAKGRIATKASQLPVSGSVEDKVLMLIYKAFDGKKHYFETLASQVTGRLLGTSGNQYFHGWITKASGDQGIDYVSRMDVGSGAARVKLVILGQAKCIDPRGTSISAGDLARVVARLRRGWIGAYVTTGTYSRAAQEELLNDEYPVLLVDGRILAEQVRLLASETCGGNVAALLDNVLADHTAGVMNRRPEEILQIEGTYPVTTLEAWQVEPA